MRAALQKEEARNGGSFILRKELREKISRLPEDDTPHDCTLAEDDISKALDWLEESGEVHTDRINGVEAVYPSQLYYAEVDVAAKADAQPMCGGQADAGGSCQHHNRRPGNG